MKFLCLLVILISFIGCSFDDKSGIWKNDRNEINANNNDNQFKDFKKISSSYDFFDKIIPLDKKKTLIVPKLVNPSEWRESFYSNNNNTLTK